MNTVYIAFPESKECKKQNNYPVVFNTETSQLKFQLKVLNDKGYGIFHSVNQMNDGTGRKEEDLAQLNYVYCDFDLAKEGDDIKGLEAKKIKAIKDLSEHCKPNFIVMSKNGFHPYWKLKDTDKNNVKEYVEINKGIIDYSVLLESAGDAVYDVARVLRTPNYHHMKSDPFKCELVSFHNNEFTYKELRDKFPYSPPTEKIYNPTTKMTSLNNPSIADIFVKVMATQGHAITFKKLNKDKWQVINQDGSRGAFLTNPESPDGLVHNGGTSTLNFDKGGNATTFTGRVLGMDNKNAWKWVCKEFDIKLPQPTESLSVLPTVVKIKKEKVHFLDKEVRTVWNTEVLSNHIGHIDSSFIIIAAPRFAGKTTFALDLAIKNAKNCKCLFINLEQDSEELFRSLCLSTSQITQEQYRNKTFTPAQVTTYKSKYSQLKNLKNITFYGASDFESRKLSDITNKVIESNPEIIIVDNLDKIEAEEGEDNLAKQKRVTEEIGIFCRKQQKAFVLIHHYKKAGDNDKGMDELSGSGKISDNADIIIKIQRVDPNSETEDKYASKITWQKDRVSRTQDSRIIFFSKGEFVDSLSSQRAALKKELYDKELASKLF